MTSDRATNTALAQTAAALKRPPLYEQATADSRQEAALQMLQPTKVIMIAE
jgi:hypothetical protein